ncbi:MAG: FmdB family zinc ribbon protein, partial [Planctomycetota bacterium]
TLVFKYECEGCETSVEILVRNSDEKLECPECGGDALTKLISAPAAPSTNGGTDSLPMASGESCGAPRCCGGTCDL